MLLGALEVFGVWAFGGWGDPENLAGRIAWLAALPALVLTVALFVGALRLRTADA